MISITRTSSFTGVTRTKEFDITPLDLANWQEGMFIQDAMPKLSADEREFIMTGVTAEEWTDTFGE